MQTIQLLAVGGLKEGAFAVACAEYQKRLSAYCKLSVVEIPEHRLPKNPAEAEIRHCVEQESALLLEKISPRAYVIALCIEGKQISSNDLAAKLDGLAQTHSQVALIVGGSHGLSPGLKARADFSLSMSQMTFPHQLARVMLLEQLYRGFSIINGSKYHK